MSIQYYTITCPNEGQSKKEIFEDFDRLIRSSEDSVYFRQKNLTEITKDMASQFIGGRINEMNFIRTLNTIRVIGVSF